MKSIKEITTADTIQHQIIAHKIPRKILNINNVGKAQYRHDKGINKFECDLPLSVVYVQLCADIRRLILEHRPDCLPVHKHDTYILQMSEYS